MKVYSSILSRTSPWYDLWLPVMRGSRAGSADRGSQPKRPRHPLKGRSAKWKSRWNDKWGAVEWIWVGLGVSHEDPPFDTHRHTIQEATCLWKRRVSKRERTKVLFWRTTSHPPCTHCLADAGLTVGTRAPCWGNCGMVSGDDRGMGLLTYLSWPRARHGTVDWTMSQGTHHDHVLGMRLLIGQ